VLSDAVWGQACSEHDSQDAFQIRRTLARNRDVSVNLTHPEESQASACASRTGGGQCVLSVRAVGKQFGPTRALESCSFELQRGEILAILGENGSGKSTLVKILSGVYRPDGGTIDICGTMTAGFSSPGKAISAGVGTVFQEVLVSPTMSVLDNVCLGRDRLLKTGMSRGTKRELARSVLGELLGRPLDLDQPIEQLSLPDRQACCIARALIQNPRLLILDEATSALDIETRARLFGVVRRRAADEAVGVILITHRMDEIEELADTILVLRSGLRVGRFCRGEASSVELVRTMTGDNTSETTEARAADRVVGDVLIETRSLRLRPEATPIDFQLRSGEIVGLAGLEGHGQDAFLQSLRGVQGLEGEVLTPSLGKDARLRSPFGARGIAYVPRERGAEGTFEAFDIRENFALPTIRRDVVHGLISSKSIDRRFSEYVESLRIRLGRPSDSMGTLSGGNQQKVIIARWLAAEPTVLLLNDPTRGIDHGAKRDIYVLLATLARNGTGVVVLSTEIDEHLHLMDRVLVFREGAVFCEIPRSELSRARLGAAYFGQAVPRND
jgi:ABC-type sugar transport system ATPase subunit